MGTDRDFCARISDALKDEQDVRIITDSNVKEAVLPLLADSYAAGMPFGELPLHTLPAGEEHKGLKELTKVWQWLSEGGATRRSLLLCIGGGTVTDLGGFAAATFKRGIRHINIPTTLLGMADAAVGGKTGIDFNGLKNEIGAFHMPERVIVEGAPLRTLPERELLSGLGEVLKTALIADPELYRRTEKILTEQGATGNPERLGEIAAHCAAIKEETVREDPMERGKRKILNFGHTFGHAFEMALMEKGRTMAHGIAVAHGLLAELILSHLAEGLDSAELYRYNSILKEFPMTGLRCADSERLMELMAHDKKNRTPDAINFTLLRGIGEPIWDRTPDRKDIQSAYEIYLDLTN